ncbi:GntR family transcriptional regulator [Flaviflexus salsibiostraticola]|uniref:GntR family transcriptional regulator n=1 Tax=Flaviflexus salsibiostraticola TaxID=1282737 RepID=A0A3S8Z7P1_9ACTO|nr:GntR family transcriptional regulator [Flaviflexus salsibiostraticola]AZN29473.1 GntR family transcriptional regulator [Flaviflexus salsibiostraticola]
MTPDTLDSPYIVDIRLERESTVPLYQQIAEPLTKLIMSGAIEPGRLIEDEVSLAQRLDVSRPTARRALQELVSSGLLVRRRGVGTRVTPTHVHRQIGLTSLNADLEAAGYVTRTEVLNYQVQLADEDQAARLACDIGDEVVVIERLRWINDRPLGIMHNTIPAPVAPSLTELTQKGLYACLSERGVRLATGAQTIGARVASEREANLLAIATGAPLLSIERTAYDASGDIVEFGRHVYDATQYNITIPLVAD